MVARWGGPGTIGERWIRALDTVDFRYESGLTSRFNRQPVVPGAIYELGWGGRDDFLVIGRDSASTLSDRELIRMRGGLLLPGSYSVDLGYEHARHQTLDTRSDRKDRREVWPDVTASVTDVTLPGFLSEIVQRVSLSAGYRRQTRTLQFGTGARQNRFREEQAAPVSATFLFPRRASLTYRGRRDDSETSDPTGNTRSEKNSHSLSASAMLPSPVAVFRRQDAPMRITLSLTYRNEVRCRVQSEAAPCVAFIDQLNREASVSVDSTLRDYRLGARLHYLDQRSFVGRRAGLTRIQLAIFGQFVLTPDLLVR